MERNKREDVKPNGTRIVELFRNDNFIMQTCNKILVNRKKRSKSKYRMTFHLVTMVVPSRNGWKEGLIGK